METATHQTLIDICHDPEINLSFSPYDRWEENTDDEQIILALISDYNADKLIPAIKRAARVIQ